MKTKDFILDTVSKNPGITVDGIIEKNPSLNRKYLLEVLRQLTRSNTIVSSNGAFTKATSDTPSTGTVPTPNPQANANETEKRQIFVVRKVDPQEHHIIDSVTRVLNRFDSRVRRKRIYLSPDGMVMNEFGYTMISTFKTDESTDSIKSALKAVGSNAVVTESLSDEIKDLILINVLAIR